MPDADFFPRLGLYIRKGFIDAEMCRKIRTEMCSVEQHRALTLRYGQSEVIVDENFRNCAHAKVSKDTNAIIKEGLEALKSDLEKHFNVTLTHYERPSFLLYRAGDFFAPHVDVDKSPGESDDGEKQLARLRKVSLVLFLNDQTENPAPYSFTGGSLTFFGLLDNPDLKHYGFPLRGEEGLLVAFSSDVMHEVKSVIQGERYTIVSWFY